MALSLREHGHYLPAGARPHPRPSENACVDRVYAPYVVSVVPDPPQVAREMRRVCRPGGTIVILNHFRTA